ncbi:MAG: phosphatidate cytidylyltransferase [Mollicutes bacterium]|nr:phosphatidate cytidylyltransferase [Mollicutes bacterium]
MKIRVISAFVVIAILIPFIYFGGAIYAFIIGIIAILGFKEIIDLKKHHQMLPFIPCLFSMTGLLFITYNNFNSDYIYGLTSIILIGLFLSLFIPTIVYKNDVYKTSDAMYLYGATIFLGMGFNSLIFARNISLGIFIFLILIPIITDTAAMITGKYFGKNKLCPKISPRKTFEGAIGGTIFGVIIPLLFYKVVVGNVSLKLVIATIILSVIGQIGDLIFSKMKRENDIKDFSNIMPGHGGVLDRIDSVLFVSIMYVVLKLIFL